MEVALNFCDKSPKQPLTQHKIPNKNKKKPNKPQNTNTHKKHPKISTILKRKIPYNTELTLFTTPTKKTQPSNRGET